MGTSYVEQAFAVGANQLASLWDFTISGANDDTPWSQTMTFEVEDMTLPFPKLTMEKLVNGENYYSGIEFPNEVSITLRETVNFTCLSYFQNWFDLVYDLNKRVFISHTDIEKGGIDDKIHRQGKLTFRSFDMSSKQPTETIYKQEFKRPYIDSILKQQEVSSIIVGTANNMLTSAQSALSGLAGVVGAKLGSGYRIPTLVTKVPIPVAKVGSIGSSPESASVNSGGWTEKSTYVFTLENLLIIGIEDLSLSYTEGGPLLIKVNMSTENVSGAAASNKAV
jgi:hypothetical protein